MKFSINLTTKTHNRNVLNSTPKRKRSNIFRLVQDEKHYPRARANDYKATFFQQTKSFSFQC